MRNKRRTETEAAYAGTETGSVTYTVTFFPDDFEEDAKIVEMLDKLAKRKKANAYLRDAVIGFISGGSKQAAQTTPRESRSAMANSAPVEYDQSDRGDDATSRIAQGMGLKIGGKKK